MAKELSVIRWVLLLCLLGMAFRIGMDLANIAQLYFKAAPDIVYLLVDVCFKCLALIVGSALELWLEFELRYIREKASK
jgi:hypothetical protein